MCGTVQRFTKTACYTDFFSPLFLMLSIHEAHYSVLLLYGFFLSVFLLWAATALLSPPAYAEGFAAAGERDGGSGREEGGLEVLAGGP